jgi:hypothetical protein
MTIQDNGAVDFWGNPVPDLRGAADRGAHEYPGANVSGKIRAWKSVVVSGAVIR